MRYGHARISSSGVEPRGVCDRCGWVYSLSDLHWQYKWAGTELQNTRFRVCRTCMDVPNMQLRAIIIPPDPVPVHDPRPDLNAIMSSDSGTYYEAKNFLATEDGKYLMTQDGKFLMTQSNAPPATYP